MSRFIETLGRVGEQSSAPMGFARPVQIKATPPVVIAGSVTPEALAETPDLARTDVDAVVLVLETWNEKAIEAAIAHLGESLWGLRTNSLSSDQARYLVEKGCDFVMFGAEDTSVGVLDEEDLGKLISITPDLDEDAARAIAALSLDGAFFTPDQASFPLTVRKLMDIGRIRGLLDTAFVMEAPGELSGEDLSALRDLGVAGLVLDLSAPDDVAKTREAVAALPRRKSKPARGVALVPDSSQAGAPEVPHDPDEDDEDDDF
jgi:hypothetical protein